jgi:flagellar hook-basal body complex protein FliE
MSDMEISRVLSQMRALANQIEPVAATPPPLPAGQAEFGQVFRQAIDAVSTQQNEASRMVEGFQNGTGTASLAEVMVAMQKSSLSFTAMTEVRNRLIEAYKEIMNMPV